MVAELDCFFVTVARPEEKVVEMAAAPRFRSRTEIKPYTGKVCEVIYDCFGHLEGFVLESCYERHHFKTSEKGIAKLSYARAANAWLSRFMSSRLLETRSGRL
jgi:hypothetical protein